MKMEKRKARYGTFGLVSAMTATMLIGGNYVLARAQADAHASPPAPAVRNTGQRSGEEIFMQNCGRCHKPPMSISPRITGTVIMHMRVRAKLSRQDQQALLHYLAP